MKENKRRLNLALSMDNPLQREAWEILEKLSGNRTNAICEAVCGYYKRKELLDDLRVVLREWSSPVPAAEHEKTNEDDEAILDFILALQRDSYA